MKDLLLFNKPGETWEHYLPLGNGRLGAMVKGHPGNEIIQLNEEGIWSGGPIDRNNPSAKENLERIRQLVKDGKVLEAQEVGFEALSGTCCNERVYQTAGDFKIDFYSADNYGIECGWPLQHKTPESYLKNFHSELDLQNACTRVFYSDDEGVNFERTTWISADDDLLFMHVRTDKKGKINFRGFLDRGIWVNNIYAENNAIFLEDSHGIPFCVGCGVVTEGGSSKAAGFCLTGENCDEALFYIDIQAFKWDKKPISKADYDKLILDNYWSDKCKSKLANIRKFILENGIGKSVDILFDRHIKEYSPLYRRIELNIGESDIENIPTPELLKSADENSTELVMQYCNFSRYLLIAGSRKPGELPTTLQGLWNCYMDPPWGSKYTININTEMNYWPVNMCNEAECEESLFELLARTYHNGKITAEKMYGCRGYVVHHNTDYWGDAAPQDTWLPGTYWVLGAAWIATHIWEHYEYTQNKVLLAKYYYLIHDACKFFVDFLQPCSLIAADGNPYLVINPSVSPENSYVTKAGQVGAFTEGCEMDNMILEHLFKSCLKAKDVLKKEFNGNLDKLPQPEFDSFNIDADDFEKYEYILQHLKKPELNSDGSLMEWNTEVPEVEVGHRHISHLYGLFPGHTISVEKTPELAEAATKTLKKRLEHGGGHTGWSQAWIINFRASLQQGDEALNAIVKLFTHSTLPNLLDNHPPFQIDGNFGTLAAVLRMLVQSETNDDGSVSVKLLPALPGNAKWQSGNIRGVCIKGGYSINFSWKNGKVDNYELIAGENHIAENLIKIG